jgi:hypothetical protein
MGIPEQPVQKQRCQRSAYCKCRQQVHVLLGCMPAVQEAQLVYDEIHLLPCSYRCLQISTPLWHVCTVSLRIVGETFREVPTAAALACKANTFFPLQGRCTVSCYRLYHGEACTILLLSSLPWQHRSFIRHFGQGYASTFWL